MLRSLSNRSRRSCIALSWDRAAWVGKAMARTISSSVERECGGVDRLGIRRPLKIRPKAGGRGSRGIDHPCIDHKSGPPVANSGVRVPLGQKKGAARLPIGEPTPIDRGPLSYPRLGIHGGWEGAHPQLTT